MKREELKEIIELPIHFDGSGTTRGFKFDQVYHINGWYIYKVMIPHSDKIHYEIFKEKIQQYNTCTDGVWTEVDNVGKVIYPCDESFGLWAWTCPTIECCMKHIIQKPSE